MRSVMAGGLLAMLLLAAVPSSAQMGMSPGVGGAGAAPHAMPVEDRPFYRDRTFLLVACVVAIVLGVRVWRLARRHRHRPGRPTKLATEAVLVVDLVGSTRLSTHYGNGVAMRARTALHDRALAAARNRGLRFSESTGDGCLMIFPSVGDAVDTARSLFHDLRRAPPDVAPAPSIDARAAVTWGEILLDGRGGRHGATINKAFRIDGLGRADVTQVEPGVTRESIPDGRRILLDEEAAQEARATGVTSDYLGLCPLKGFTGLHRVYLVDAG